MKNTMMSVMTLTLLGSLAACLAEPDDDFYDEQSLGKFEEEDRVGASAEELQIASLGGDNKKKTCKQQCHDEWRTCIRKHKNTSLCQTEEEDCNRRCKFKKKATPVVSKW